MFVLTDTTSGGIYAIKSKDRKKTVTVFEDRDGYCKASCIIK